MIVPITGDLHSQGLDLSLPRESYSKPGQKHVSINIQTYKIHGASRNAVALSSRAMYNRGHPISRDDTLSPLAKLSSFPPFSLSSSL